VGTWSICFVSKFISLFLLLFVIQNGLWSFAMDWFHGFCDGGEILKLAFQNESLFKLETLVVLKKN
jgi:hypothetical protein